MQIIKNLYEILSILQLYIITTIYYCFNVRDVWFHRNAQRYEPVKQARLQAAATTDHCWSVMRTGVPNMSRAHRTHFVRRY